MITIERKSAEDNDFKGLVRFLDRELKERDGEDHLFYAKLNKTDDLSYVLVAYGEGKPVGCGALREYSRDTVEIKRMFVFLERRGRGIATTILAALESWSGELGYEKCVLETGRNQPEAVNLYNKCGYKEIPNFGKYTGSPNSICFEKRLRPETPVLAN